MKWLALLLLLIPSLAFCQEVRSVTKLPSQEQLLLAKDTIKSAQSDPTSLPFGGYALIEIKVPGKLKCYVMPGGDDCLTTQPLAKNIGYQGWLVTKGETDFRYTKVTPDASIDRILVTGTKEGTATLIWIANGATANDEPIVVAAFQFLIGKPKPPAPKPDDPPVVPVDDALTQKLRVAANADYTAGKSDKKILLPLAGIYEAASNDSLTSVTTMNQLDDLLLQARVNAGIADPDAVYPTMRRAIQQEIYTRLGINAGSGEVKLTDASKKIARETFTKVAASLEALAK